MTTHSGKAGGYLVGRRHSAGGIAAVNTDSGQPLELESDEVIITRQAVLSEERHDFNGEQLTNLEILSRINEQAGGVALMQQGGIVPEAVRCRCSGKTHRYEQQELSDHQILHRMKSGGKVTTTPKCGCTHKPLPHAVLPDRHLDYFKAGGKTGSKPGRRSAPPPGDTQALFRGTDYPYPNPYALNRAIEALLDMRPENDFDVAEKAFLRFYSGYGGLEKFGATGKGLLYEYYTPPAIATRMWGLAYKHGYQGGSILEPSCGTGEFFNDAPAGARKTGLEINVYSARIARILHPEAEIRQQYFEELFIRSRDSIRGKTGSLEKYDLVIGNPPYGEFQGRFAGMGEKSYTRAGDYIDYFLVRGLDLLTPGGLLVFLLGAPVRVGGIPFLAQQPTPVKREIAAKATLVDAYRLPNGLFERTDVVTDIIVLKRNVNGTVR